MSPCPRPDGAGNGDHRPDDGTMPDDEADESSETPRTTVELLRWGWTQLTAAPELVAPFVLVAIVVVIAQAGITMVQTPYGRIPRFALWVWPIYLVAFLTSWVGLAAVFLAASDRLSGVERSHTRRLIIGAERTPTMLTASIIGGIAVAGGLFTLILPGVYLMLKLSLTFPACIIDDTSAVTALRRSWVLTGGRLSTIFGLLLTYTVILLVVSVIITIRVDQSHGQPGFIGPLVHNLITAVLIPMFGLVFARIYLISR